MTAIPGSQRSDRPCGDDVVDHVHVVEPEGAADLALRSAGETVPATAITAAPMPSSRSAAARTTATASSRFARAVSAPTASALLGTRLSEVDTVGIEIEQSGGRLRRAAVDSEDTGATGSPGAVEERRRNAMSESNRIIEPRTNAVGRDSRCRSRLRCRASPASDAATIADAMAGEDKPYRVYKSGRGKGKLPRRLGGKPARPVGTAAGDQLAKNTKSATSHLQGLAIAVGLFVAWAAAWTLASYFSFRDGVNAANARLPRLGKRALGTRGAALDRPDDDPLARHRSRRRRPGARRPPTDSIMLMRTDPGHDRIYYLSIPRDLYVAIPATAREPDQRRVSVRRAGARDQDDRALRAAVNHIAIVDFNEFRKVVDDIGGITVNVPKPILSNSSTARSPPPGAGRGRAGGSARASST